MFSVTEIDASWMPALYRLASQPLDSTIVVPVLYLKASNELIVLTLAISWALTLAFKYETVQNNQLQNFVGYNNPCVGWDLPPVQSMLSDFCGTARHAHTPLIQTHPACTREHQDNGVSDHTTQLS